MQPVAALTSEVELRFQARRRLGTIYIALQPYADAISRYRKGVAAIRRISGAVLRQSGFGRYHKPVLLLSMVGKFNILI